MIIARGDALIANVRIGQAGIRLLCVGGSLADADPVIRKSPGAAAPVIDCPGGLGQATLGTLPLINQDRSLTVKQTATDRPRQSTVRLRCQAGKRARRGAS
jgi:hypothetical protein